MNLKPKSLIEIRGGNSPDSFNSRSKRINLSFKRKSLIKRILLQATPYVFVALLVTLVNGKVLAPIITPDTLAQTVQITTSERDRLEREYQALEAEITQLEGTISEINRKEKSLKNEINILNSKIEKVNLQIRAVNISINRLDDEIINTQGSIVDTQANIEKNKESLTKAIKNLYVSDKAGYLEILLKNSEISDFFSNVNSLYFLQDNLRAGLEELVEAEEELVSYKKQLNLKKADNEALKAYQASQRSEIANTKAEKDNLLEITKGEEALYQQLVQKKQKTASEIRQQIFRLFGGGEMNFAEAYELARLAEQATGVRAAMILAILEQESRLGRNVGQCSPENAMHPTRDMPAFTRIIAELNANGELIPNPLLVSCPISIHGAYGGAMGPAQFIPSTWELYKSDIGRMTGNNPPNPWRNSDAFMGTALYISNSLNAGSCKGYAEENKHLPGFTYNSLLEICAATQYYAGGNWTKYSLRLAYGFPVVEKADSFQRDIDLLNS